MPDAAASRRGFLLKCRLPVNGIQNGSPDGFALVNNGVVVEFLSYEGSFAAANGSENGCRHRIHELHP